MYFNENRSAEICSFNRGNPLNQDCLNRGFTVLLNFVKMCLIFDSLVLIDFEKYKKITWHSVMWTYWTIQFCVPPMKMFYPEKLYLLVS